MLEATFTPQSVAVVGASPDPTKLGHRVLKNVVENGYAGRVLPIHKAVFTGGDRSDLQLAALETSTSVLVLTGSIRPAPAVIDRAAERQVPIILTADDTLTSVERAEEIFGRVRFKQAAKIERFTALLDQSFDFARLYSRIGLTAG